MSRFRTRAAVNRAGGMAFKRRKHVRAAISLREPTAKGNDMSSVIFTAKFHESLIFDLVERLLDYALAAEGVERLNVETIGLILRTVDTTEGFPSGAVQKVCEDIFLRDIWETLPTKERRPGVIRRDTAYRLEAATLTE